MVSSAFSRSRPVLAKARYDVSSHMVKWWKGVKPTDGQVTRTLSPYEQQIILPWFRTFPKRAYEKFTDSAFYWIGAGVITVGTAVAADKLDAQQDFSHRY